MAKRPASRRNFGQGIAKLKADIIKAGVEADDGVTTPGKVFLAAAAKRFYVREPKVRTLA